MNTRDISKFGNREREIAGKLLSAINTVNDKTSMFGEGVSVEFNPTSGMVFLVDEDFNVAAMNGDVLEDFLTCPECGTEGFSEDIDTDMKCCSDYIKDMS